MRELPGSGIWNVAAGITQPLFQGGTLRARRRAAIDGYDQAVAQYRLTVLEAFQNVADTLTAIEHDAQALERQDTAKASLDLIQEQYNAGAVSYVSLLAAQQAYARARLVYVQAFAARYTDTVTLFQALGGGWWNRFDGGMLKLTSR
jgi:outer membrane protein TolC